MSVSARPTHDAETEQYQTVFTGKVLEKLQVLLERYPTKQGALLPALWLVQQQRGWISDRNMTEVAAVLGLTPAYVKGVVTFYTMYHQHPVDSTSCRCARPRPATSVEPKMWCTRCSRPLARRSSAPRAPTASGR